MPNKNAIIIFIQDSKKAIETILIYGSLRLIKLFKNVFFLSSLYIALFANSQRKIGKISKIRAQYLN